jgi:hypothetical protein
MAGNFYGEACLADGACCDYTDPALLGASPDSLLLAFGYFFPVSAISLIFAVVCVNDPGHKVVWKKLLGLKDEKVSAGKSTSGSRNIGASDVSIAACSIASSTAA